VLGKSERFAWWTRGDWNGFFGLFTNVLTNLMVMSGLMLFTVRLPAGLVFGRILPAVGVSLVVGNVYYGYMAFQLARKENRGDVTALPYGPAVSHMFVVTLLIMGPVYWRTGNAVLAWQVGIAWAVIEAIIEIAGFAAGPFVRKHTPRAAMLAALAGLAITLIAMRPAFQIWEVPYIGFVSLGLVLLGWLGGKPLPGNIPHGLVIIVLGTAIGWATGLMRPEAVTTAVANVAVSLPTFRLGDIIEGFRAIGPYLAIALPLGVMNAIGTLNNVESAAAAGDSFRTEECMIADGIGSLVGAVLGSPFSTTVYIGHPGWKRMGARTGYSIATGVGALLVCVLGVIPVLLTVIPLVALIPILLYIGLVMGAQAFQATPREHAPAVILGLIPWLAHWGLTLVDNALRAAGTNAGRVGMSALNASGVLYQGMTILNQGAILSSMVLAAVAAYVIDRNYKYATYYAMAGVALAYFGFIHAPALGIGAGARHALGYLFLAVLFWSTRYMRDHDEGASGTS
jgi:AGZA family xanthine/uracil permease-like MFS transporter